MNKIKVIDLLKMISKGEEVPKKIQVYNDIFVLDDDNMLYKNEKTGTNLLRIYNGHILNYEPAIIEEDKKIEKIETYDIAGNIFVDDDSFKYIPIDKDKLTANEQVFVDKINEIIDKIISMEDR